MKGSTTTSSIVTQNIPFPIQNTTENNVNNNSTISSNSSSVVNVYSNAPGLDKEHKNDRDKKIEDLRSKVSILFIDDDVKFKVVSILKNAGWQQTKIIRDLKNLNDPSILNAHIVFVDIQGVGKLMHFPDEGLGLAASIKEKYPEKKMIIYSADSEGNRFHKAFRSADDQISKNAVPYEFESVIETMTHQLVQNGVF
jgi:hypothetical protein